MMHLLLAALISPISARLHLEECRTKTAVDPKCDGKFTCGWGSEEAETQAKASAGKKCIFPFKYKNITFTSCTLEDHHAPWCATAVDAGGAIGSGDGNWGRCDYMCLQSNNFLAFPCDKVPTCCQEGFAHADVFQPPALEQLTFITGVKEEEDKIPVMNDVFELDGRNELNRNVETYSRLKTMFLADLNPTELGFLLNDTRVDFVECNGIASASYTSHNAADNEQTDGDGDGPRARKLRRDPR